MSALQGKRVVITRASHQTLEFEKLLLERGAVPLAYPCIDIISSQNPSLFDNVLQEAADGSFDWLVLTSTNTVQSVADRLKILGLKLPALKIAAVGPATAEATRRLLHLEIHAIPDTYTAEALADILRPMPGMRVLLPQSAIADEKLADMLHSAGANVVTVEAYRTVIGSGGVDLPALLEADSVDAVTFTSPSTVYNLLKRFETERGNPSLLKSACVACIGTKTASATRELGFAVTVMPEEHTIPGLVAALEQYFESEMRHDVQNERQSGENL